MQNFNLVIHSVAFELDSYSVTKISYKVEYSQASVTVQISEENFATIWCRGKKKQKRPKEKCLIANPGDLDSFAWIELYTSS